MDEYIYSTVAIFAGTKQNTQREEQGFCSILLDISIWIKR